jgi:hypothetical protein
MIPPDMNRTTLANFPTKPYRNDSFYFWEFEHSDLKQDCQGGFEFVKWFANM